MDRAAGRVADGARLRGRVRPQVQRAVRLDPARACCSCCRSWTRGGRSGCCTSTCSCCSPSASRTSSSTAARSRPRCRSSTRVLAYLLVRMLLVGFRRRERAGRARAATCRCAWLALGARSSSSASASALNVDRLERDRRRLLGRDRRRPDRRRRRALRRDVPEGQPARRHLRAGELPGLRAVRAGAAVDGRWDDLPAAHGAAITLRPADVLAGLFLLGRRLRRPARSASRSRTPGPRIPYTPVRALDERQRRARGGARASGALLARLVRTAAAAALAGARRRGEVRAAARSRRCSRPDGRAALARPARRSGSRSRRSAPRRSCRSSPTAACASSTTARWATRPAAARRSAIWGQQPWLDWLQHRRQGRRGGAGARRVAFVPAPARRRARSPRSPRPC